MAFAEIMAARFHQQRRDVGFAQKLTESALNLSTEHGFRFFGVQASILRGWTLAEQGQTEEGITRICLGLAAYEAGTETFRVDNLILLAEAYGKAGQTEEGFATLAEALTVVDKSGERFYEAELYRLKGELLLNDERRMQNEERQTKEEQQ